MTDRRSPGSPFGPQRTATAQSGPGSETPTGMVLAQPLWKQQLPLLAGLAVTLLLAWASSNLLRPALIPLFWEPPFYVNPLVTLTFVIYTGLGLVLLSGQGDQGWPFFAGLVGIWFFVVGFEFSIVQWFLIQGGILTSARWVNIPLYIMCAAALGIVILLHTNQLRRRLFNDLRQRGVEQDQLMELDRESHRESRSIILRLVGLAAIATVVLWIGDWILGRTRLGLDVLGILVGLLIMSGLLAYSFIVLKKGQTVEGGSTSSAPAGDARSMVRSPGLSSPLPSRGQHRAGRTAAQETWRGPVGGNGAKDKKERDRAQEKQGDGAEKR